MAYKNPEPKLDEIVEEILEDKGNDYIKSEEVYFAFIDVLGRFCHLWYRYRTIDIKRLYQLIWCLYDVYL